MNIVIDGVALPTPDKEGFAVSEQIEYSENAGSSASGLWSGDIKSVKKNVSITWTNLTNDKALLIFNAITNKMFFSFTATDPLEPTQNIAFTARRTQGQDYVAKLRQGEKYRINTLTITVVER